MRVHCKFEILSTIDDSGVELGKVQITADDKMLVGHYECYGSPTDWDVDVDTLQFPGEETWKDAEWARQSLLQAVCELTWDRRMAVGAKTLQETESGFTIDAEELVELCAEGNFPGCYAESF